MFNSFFIENRLQPPAFTFLTNGKNDQGRSKITPSLMLLFLPYSRGSTSIRRCGSLGWLTVCRCLRSCLFL